VAYSMKDLESAGRNLNQHFERNAEQKGEELANRLIQSTSQGRGLWFIILWPAWFGICFFSGSFLMSGLEELFAIKPPLSLIGYLGGYAFAMAWYRWGYTIRHPLLGSMIGYFGTAFSVLYFADKIGWM